MSGILVYALVGVLLAEMDRRLIRALLAEYNSAETVDSRGFRWQRALRWSLVVLLATAGGAAAAAYLLGNPSRLGVLPLCASGLTAFLGTGLFRVLTATGS